MTCAGAAGAVALHGVHSVRSRIADARERKQAQSRLAHVLRSDEFNREIEEVSGRFENGTAGMDMLLRARVDHLREVQQIWGQETRRSAMEQVAAIMKRSVRSGDASGRAGDVVSEVDGDSFTILVRGAKEKDASLIAKRLRDELARRPIDGLSDNIRLTASFGAAGRRAGESFAMWRARAEAALGARSEDGIVDACEVEEVKLLPPPSAMANPRAA